MNDKSSSLGLGLSPPSHPCRRVDRIPHFSLRLRIALWMLSCTGKGLAGAPKQCGVAAPHAISAKGLTSCGLQATGEHNRPTYSLGCTQHSLPTKGPPQQIRVVPRVRYALWVLRIMRCARDPLAQPFDPTLVGWAVERGGYQRRSGRQRLHIS